VLVALLSSYLFARRLTRPSRVLTATATQVAKGNLHIKAPITSRDEIGLLAQTFNLMTTQVEQAQATLEERVNQRTQELSETNERLKHEIVERQRYEKQALDLAIEHERRRILSEFIQKASHEFKTPLSVINVNAYLARRFLPEDRQRHINTIEEQGRHIERLVNRMVLMTRLDSGMSPVSEEFQVDEFVRTLHTNASSAVEEKRAVVHLDLQAAGTSICADSKLLFVALQNILENALKYSAEQVEISLRTRANGETVTIMVQDNGIGIPAGLQGQVFERFFRVDEAHTTRGFGLGLPIAKRIIEDMGGTIDLHSAEGEGTTVTVTLAIKPRTPA
jgi:signal transduction histidine kinase